MKKILIILLISLGVLSAEAKSIWFTGYSYAVKYKNNYNRNNSQGWSSFQKCNVDIEFKIDDDVIVIYSNRTQAYAIYENAGTYTDNEGGQQQGYYVLDQDYDKGMIRLRIARDGTSQLYVDFNDVGWVYNVIRK
jgi:hypothetical protein